MNTDSPLEETSVIKLYGQMFWHRRWSFLATVLLVFSSMVVYTLTRTKVYESSLLLLVNSKDQMPQVINQDPKETPSESSESGAHETEIEILSTLPLLTRTVNDLQSRYPDLDVASLDKRLKIKQVGKSDIISVTYRDTNPERLIQVLSQLGQTYVDFSLTSRKSRVTSAIKFIERTLPEAQQNLAVRSQQLEIFRKRYELSDPRSLGTNIAQSLSNLNDREQVATATLSQSQALYQNLRQRSGLLPTQALAAGSLSQDPIYLDLLKQYQEAENQYTLAGIQFKDDNPQLQNLQAKKDRLKQLLQNRMQQVLGKSVSSVSNIRLFVPSAQTEALQVNQVSQLLEAENNIKVQQANIAAIQVSRKALEEKFRTVPELQRQYDSLSQEVEVSSKSVDNLLTKLEELRIVEAQESAAWQIIQPPYPVGKPVSPNIPLNLIFGSVLALLSGGSVVFLQEHLDSRLKRMSSVREMLSIPILGVIPQIDQLPLPLNAFPSNDRLAFLANDAARQPHQFCFREAFQHLLFNLRLVSANSSMQAVGFTSSIFREGKSTVVQYLGSSAAERSCRVLLIDGDLRKPELHLALGVHNEQGLSNILAHGVSWQEVVQDTIQPGLQVIAAGPIPVNPVALLDSVRMGQLMTQLRNHYDLVLMDLPPINGLTDPLVVATHLDGLVLVVGLDRTTRENLKTSLESLSYNRSRFIGAVCNMVRISEMPNSAYLQDNKAKRLSNPGQLVRLLQKSSRR